MHMHGLIGRRHVTLMGNRIMAWCSAWVALRGNSVLSSRLDGADRYEYVLFLRAASEYQLGIMR